MKQNKKIMALLALTMMTCVSQSVILNAQEEPTEKVPEVETSKEQETEVQETEVQESEAEETVATVNPEIEEKGIVKVYAEAIKSNVSTYANGDIEINTTTFPDATFRNYVITTLNGGDTTLTAAKINTITSIEASDWNIQSLVGIEYFTALTGLRCNGILLTSLDVSKNTALTELYCNNNQLTSLDVSKNTALTTLYCYSNPLTNLDLSKNTALEYLRCGNGTLLTSLDVSKNTALEYLSCEKSELTNFDVSKNTALTTLYCNGNQLTSLDVSKNTALTSLDCNGNQLTSLDVSKNTALTSLYCDFNLLTSLDVSKNTALTSLDCYNNQLTSLDVSKNTALTTLYCNGNQLTSLDVSKNTALTSLNASQAKTIALEKGKDTIDLATLNSEIDTSKISSLTNATLKGSILSELKNGKSVTYNYDCGNSKTMDVTLKIQLKAPDFVEPSGLKIKEGKTLSEITLPTGWTWVDPTTVVSISTRAINTYPARSVVDDEKYDYTGVSGYNATGHYVERSLIVNVIQNPVINPDGSTTIFPGDTVTTPDGTITLPEGGVIKPDGSIVVKPGGSIVTPDGTITFPNGGSLNADGTITKTEDPNKPSAEKSGSNTNVNTGDQSNQKGFVALFGMSSFMILNLLKKRNKSVEENR